MSDYNINGSCLCGQVAYRITGHMGIFQYCHCSRCRKFTGSAFAANLLVNPDDFTWTRGESHVSRYELPNVNHFATCFCDHCGSSLPWLAQSARVVVVPAGTLDEDPVIRPSQNIFCASRAIWHKNPESLIEYDELPASKQ